MLAPVPTTWDAAAPLLLPALRRPLDPPAAHALGDAPQLALVGRPADATDALQLRAVVVADLPGVRRFIQQHHLDAWGVSASHALDAALLRLAESPADGLDAQAGRWTLAAGDGYEAARLLLPGWLAAFADRVPGTPVAFAPTTRHLWVVGSEDPLALDQALNDARIAFDHAAEPLCAAPITLNPTLGPLLLPADHPRAAVVATAWRRHYAHVAATQTDWLLDHGPEGLAVPALSLWRGPDGAGRLFARWHEGDVAWVPQTADLVVLVPEVGDVLALPLSSLETLVVPNLSPVRVALARFPSASARHALRAQSVAIPGVSE